MLNRAIRSPTKAKRQSSTVHRQSKNQASHEKGDFGRRYAAIVLGIIKAKYANTTFTRDDVLASIAQMRPDSKEAWATVGYGLNDVTTGTRYRHVCHAVALLLTSDQLKSLDWLRLCLPSAFVELAAEVPPPVMYVSTIRRLVRENFKRNTQLDAMMVVRVWTSDQHLPENVKRMAVRGIFPTLIQEKILQRGEYQTFTVC